MGRNRPSSVDPWESLIEEHGSTEDAIAHIKAERDREHERFLSQIPASQHAGGDQGSRFD